MNDEYEWGRVQSGRGGTRFGAFVLLTVLSPLDLLYLNASIHHTLPDTADPPLSYIQNCQDRLGR
jgi:hypothetical protein